MREEQHAARALVNSDNDLVCPGPDVARRFAFWTAIFEQAPGRLIRAYVSRCSSFVLAIIPFGQIWVDGRDRTEAGELTRASCPHERAGEHIADAQLVEFLLKRDRLLLAAPRQRNVAAARVLTGERPRGFAMTNQVDAGQTC